MATTIQAMPLSALVDLVNEWGAVPRAEAGEEGTAYPEPTGLTDHLGPEASAVALSDAALAAVASRLHPVFSADTLHDRAALVNAMLLETGIHPVAAEVGGSLGLGWLVERREDALLASASITLLQQLTTGGWDRLGCCAGRRCADVYVDLSPQGVRRFCSVSCSNRARAAAFRRRHVRPR